jgi:hypothetical protein
MNAVNIRILAHSRVLSGNDRRGPKSAARPFHHKPPEEGDVPIAEPTRPTPRALTDYVNDIKTAAYIVKEVEGEGGVVQGCFIRWNDEFEKLTKFSREQLETIRKSENVPCKDLLQGQQEEGVGFLDVCTGPCPWRVGKEAVTLENVWVNTNEKDKQGNTLKRLVTMHVFPYTQKGNKYALHIVVDQPQKRAIPGSSGG